MNMDFDTMRDTMTAAAEPEDYTGADGLLYCGKCRKPKESYFSEGKTLFGRDRHPAECDCQRKIREERQAAEEHRRHLETVEELKRRGFSDTAMREWTFENDNGQNPQTATARFFVDHWEEMQEKKLATCSGGTSGAAKATLQAVLQTPSWRKRFPSI